MPYSPPASCLVWYKADAEAYSNGANATVLHDQSGNGNDTNGQVGTVTYTTGVINSLPAFSFPGNAFYSFPNANPTAFSIICAVSMTGDCVIASGSVIQIRYGQSGGNVLSAYDGLNNPISSALSTTQGSWAILEWVCDGSIVTFYEGGVLRGSGSLNNVNGTLNLIYLGSLTGIVLFCNGYMAEFLYCNTALGSTDRTNMEAYLTAKYFGSPAPSNTPLLRRRRIIE